MAFVSLPIIALGWYLSGSSRSVPSRTNDPEVSAQKIDKAIALPAAPPIHEGAVAPAKPGNDVPPSIAKFIRVPNANDMIVAYPRDAFRDGIKGSVTLACAANEQGKLVDCQVVAENPLGHGFGLAALRLSTKYQLAARSEAELLREGERYKIALGFSFED